MNTVPESTSSKAESALRKVLNIAIRNALLLTPTKRLRLAGIVGPRLIPEYKVWLRPNRAQTIHWTDGHFHIEERRRWLWAVAVAVVLIGLCASWIYVFAPSVRTELQDLWNHHPVAICAFVTLAILIFAVGFLSAAIRRSIDIDLNGLTAVVQIRLLGIMLKEEVIFRPVLLVHHATSVSVSKAEVRIEHWVVLHARRHVFLLLRALTLEQATEWAHDHLTVPSRHQLIMATGDMWACD